MMQPPVKTSAVRASTYLPLTEVPAKSEDPTDRPEPPETIIRVFIATSIQGGQTETRIIPHIFVWLLAYWLSIWMLSHKPISAASR